jgi:hypothetical protein
MHNKIKIMLLRQNIQASTKESRLTKINKLTQNESVPTFKFILKFSSTGDNENRRRRRMRL